MNSVAREPIFSLVSDGRKWNQILWLLTLVGLVVRVAAVFILNDYRDPLTAEYGIVAQNLVEGKGFVGGGWLGPEMPTALNTPIYPLFLAAWLWLDPPLPFLGVQLCQALLSALIVWLVGKIVLHLLDPDTGLLSGLLTAFYLPLIYFCKQISPAIFTTFFTVLSFYGLLLFFEKPSWKKAIALGVLEGIALLVEPVLLLALPGGMLILWIGWYKNLRTRILPMLVVNAVVCLCVLLPWTIRNYIVFHRVVLLKTSFGLNFWMGNNPNATGFLYTADGRPMQDTLPPSKLEYLSSLNEAERYEMLQQEAWEWIRLHPAQFARLTLRRIGYLWLISPTYLVTDQNITEPLYFYGARQGIQTVLLIVASMGGILIYRSNRLFLGMSIWWFVAFTLPYAVSVAGNTRYRLPVEPIMLVLAAAFLNTLIQRIRRTKMCEGGLR